MSTSTARASMPASSACASVLPTAATWGSVKVTRGEPSLRRSPRPSRPRIVLGGDPGLVLAHVGEQRAAVDVADRVEPVAAARPAAGRRSRGSRARRLDPDASPGRCRRCAACGRRRRGSPPPRPRRRPRARRRPRSPSRRTDSPCAPVRTSTPQLSRSASATCSPANGSSRGSSRSLALDQGDRRCRASTRPAPARRRPARRRARSCSPGTSLRGRRLAVVPGARPRRGRRSAASPRCCRWRRRPPCAPRSDVVADDHAPLAVEPALAAEQLDPALLQPGQLAGVVEVVDHLVAAVEHRLRRRARRSPPRRRPARASPRPAARRGAAAPSTACRRSRSTRRRPGAARRSPPRGRRRRAARRRPRPAGPAPITIASKLALAHRTTLPHRTLTRLSDIAYADPDVAVHPGCRPCAYARVGGVSGGPRRRWGLPGGGSPPCEICGSHSSQLGQVPVPVAEQLHRRRQQHAAHQRRVDQHRHREADAQLLEDRAARASRRSRTPRPSPRPRW